MFHYFGWVSWISSRSTWLKIPVRSDNNIHPGNRSSPVTGRANMKRPWKDNVYSLKIIRKLCHWIDFNSLHILGSGYFFFFFFTFLWQKRTHGISVKDKGSEDSAIIKLLHRYMPVDNSRFINFSISSILQYPEYLHLMTFLDSYLSR